MWVVPRRFCNLSSQVDEGFFVGRERAEEDAEYEHVGIALAL
jgi:hypothetical protein